MNARCGTTALEHATSPDPKFEPFAPSIRAIAEMLRACVDADVCLVAVEGSGGESGQLYGTGALASDKEAALCQATRALLELPAEPVLLNGQPVPPATRRAAAAVAAAADLTQVSSFICLPMRVSALNVRICIAAEQRCFTSVDLLNVAPLAEQVRTVMESVYFGERLAMDLARHERRQISRDLHDSAIQPFIGLKLGLEAMRRRVAEEDHLVKDLDDLIAIAGAGIEELREYVGTLRAASSANRIADDLASAVRCQAQKFSALYGIQATVIASGELSISGPMQHEVIQIIREGLSNIRRHTEASRAAIHIRQRDGRLLLEIRNDNGGQARPCRGFLPRSISERAKELGGGVRVSRRKGHTVVAVELPI